MAGPKLRRLLAKHIHHLFAGEPNAKRFRVALDQALLNKDLSFVQVSQSVEQEVVIASWGHFFSGAAVLPHCRS
jgi:hypothetical protein